MPGEVVPLIYCSHCKKKKNLSYIKPKTFPIPINPCLLHVANWEEKTFILFVVAPEVLEYIDDISPELSFPWGEKDLTPSVFPHNVSCSDH